MAWGQMANCTTWQLSQVHSYLGGTSSCCQSPALRSLSCPCFAQFGIWRLAYYTADADQVQKELSTAGSVFREISLQINFFQSMKLISPLEHRMLLQLQVQKPLQSRQSRLLLIQFLRFSCPSHTSVLARSHVISAHFTKQAQKINIPILSFKYSHCLWVPKNTPKLKTDTNLEVMLENKGPDNFSWPKF